MNADLRYGSLFSGYGGLDAGVQSILGGSTAWHSEIEPGPVRVLDHHHPGVPNLGDITTVDWSTVEPVDVLTGGFPCQDVSHAGKRLGLKPGTRSGLWSHMAYAIDKLRPSLVVAENVRGLLSAEAGGDVEQCPWCVGNGTGSPLRALGAVLGDLAELGYDTQWHGLRAADAGAPHGRFRVFVFAWPADAQSDPRRFVDGDGGITADAASDGRDERRPEPAGQLGRPHAPVSGHATTTNASRQRHGRPALGARTGRVERVDGEDAGCTPWEERERSREVAGGGGATAPADADCADSSSGRHERPTEACVVESSDGTLRRSAPTDWGDYAPAIHRWEHTLGRPAPAPTESGPKGGQRLSPAFVEWLMGLPVGHVTDPAIGLTRNEQLKALGNGVVPQQAALATRLFLASRALAVAA